MRARRLIVAACAAAMAVACAPEPAHAQLGWVKKLLGRDKKKPAATAPAVPGQPAAPGAAGAAAPGAAASIPGVVPGAVPGQAAVVDPAAQQAAQQRQAEKDTLMAYGRRLDAAQPQTTRSAKERLDFWEGLRISGATDLEVVQRYQGALRDYDQLRAQDSVRRAGDSSAAALNSRIERATRAVQARDLSSAESSVNEILAANPNDQRALVLRDRIRDLQKARQFKIVLFSLGAALLGLAALAGVIARKVMKKKEKEEGGSAPAKGGAAAGPKALLKVVDGVGRGRLFTIEGDVFRIGAAASERPEERNDIVLSDSAKSISRFHCSIIRRGKDFFLIDSSTNGTEINDRRLDPGDHHRLEDGDELTLASVTRMKFLRT